MQSATPHGTRRIPVLLGPARGHRFAQQGVRGSAVIAGGRYEWPVARFLRSHLRPATVFFDVGAHTGYFTRLALKTIRDGVVVAFEPDPRWHGALLSLGAERVILRPEAAGRSDGVGTLVSAPLTCSRLEGAIAQVAARTTRTPALVRSLDGLVERGELPPPDVVKIDVEGSELDVLGGAEHTLARVRALAVECHSMPLLRDVLDLAIRAGFDRIQSTRGGDGIGPPSVLASRS